MKAVIQRVSSASVKVDNNITGAISKGLMILLGVENSDSEENATKLAEKISRLRIFNDKSGKMNLSVLDINGQALVVSQFTLMADTRKGNRPSFIEAAPPQKAIPLYDFFCEKLRTCGIPVENGVFGAEMQVNIVNEGPVTILLEM